MKLDKTSNYRPGVALATVAAALTIAAGVTISALASYATSSDPADVDTTGTVAADDRGRPPSADAGETTMAAQREAPVEPEQEPAQAARRGREHERRGDHHERAEHAREQEDDDDDD